MAALNFPSSPTLGQTHTENGKVWVWTGYAWVTEATGLTANDIGVTVQGYDADIPTVSASQVEMEAGTETALRSMSPLRVKQAIDALAPPVTIADSTSIDLSLTGQQISAAAIFGTTSGTVAEGNHTHASLYQPLDADLTAIAGLSGTTGLLKKTAANTWSLDTTAYTTNLGTVTSVGLSVPTGLSVSGTPITSSGTLAISLATGYSIPTTTSQSNWDTAYTDRLKWDGGSTGLTAATGRTSLGATTVGGNLFTLANPSAITFPRINADNTVSTLDAASFRTAIGAGTSSTTGTVTSVSGTGTVNGLTLSGTVTSSGSLTLGGTLNLSAYNAAGAFTTLSSSSTTTLNGTTIPASKTLVVTTDIGSSVQAYDADLTAIAGIAGTSGLLKKTAADTWSLDTSTYLTGNQSLTLSGDATGSGATAITVTLANSGVTAGTYKSVTVDAKGRVTGGTNPTTLSGYGITDAAPSSHVGATGTAHGNATTSVAGFMSSTDKTKLDGIASGATANTGTVTSVGLSLPALFTVTGSPVTSSGTLTATLASQTANQVWAAPDGAAGTPTFRQLQMTDIPGAAYKRSVKVATTAAITLSGTQTIDGVAVVAGDRVLVKDQATAATNGIYVVAAGAWTRSLDADTIDEIASALVPVDSGTTNGGKLFDNDLKTTDALGTTAITWGRILDTGALASVAPLASGTAAVGTSELVARQDHVHPINTLTLGTGLSGTSYNGSAAVTAAVSYGTTATTACVGNDSRLSDTRNTTNSITFNTSGGAAAGTTFNGSAARTVDYSTVGAAASSHTHSYLPLAGGTLTGQLISTDTYDAATGGGNIYLNSATGNRIDFNTNGVAAPAFTTRSAGTKLVLYPNVGAAAVDFAIGIESSNMWFSTYDNINAGFKWYGGTTNTMSLLPSGILNVVTGFRVNGAATSGQYLRGNGTNFVSSAIQAADIPTLNQNTTGSAGSVAWSGVTSKPTTLAGYGITDAASSTHTHSYLSATSFTSGAFNFDTFSAGTLVKDLKNNSSITYTSAPSGFSSGAVMQFEGSHGRWMQQWAMQQGSSSVWVRGAYDNAGATAWYAWYRLLHTGDTATGVQFGSLGIGTAASGTTGEIRATNNITAYYSDKRLKTIYGEIPDALGKVERMSGIYFQNNEVAESFGYTDKSQQVGVIAQQVQEEVPEAVKRAPFDAAFTEDGEEYSISGEDYLTVQYEKLVPVLLQAIKELNAKVKLLEERYNA